MTKYDFSQFEDYFARERDFSVTKEMYSNMVGADFPSSMPYAINRSGKLTITSIDVDTTADGTKNIKLNREIEQYAIYGGDVPQFYYKISDSDGNAIVKNFLYVEEPEYYLIEFTPEKDKTYYIDLIPVT